MDIYEWFDKSRYILMTLAAFTFVLMIYFGGLSNLQIEVDNSQQMEYRRTVVLENLLNADYTAEEIAQTSTIYDFRKKRAVLPIEFFVNENPAEGELGFRKKNGHCYIPRVAGLDGENFAFYVRSLYPQDQYTENHRDLQCSEIKSASARVHSPALLIRSARENPRLPVRVYVYSVPGS